MSADFIQVIFFLLTGIALIILLTARLKVHAFFALSIACFVVGMGVQLPVEGIVTAMKEGFGHIMKSLGFIIVDRKSTRLNSSHVKISYAVFCLKKKIN